MLDYKQIFRKSVFFNVLKSTIFIIAIIYLLKIESCTSTEATKVHRTKEAREKQEDLFCYACDYQDQGEYCENINKTKNSNLTKKCQPDEMCIVKRFSYTTATENATSEKKLWSLQRNCTNKCESGCIVIGERTKLYACTYCCNNSLCNTTAGSNRLFKENRIFLIEIFALFIIFRILSTFFTR